MLGTDPFSNVSITAGGTTNGGLVFPANSQALVYDADGNLTFDGIWTYQWDAENRLISMSMNNIYGIADSNVLQLTFAYDYMNRRISKTVWTNSGSGFVPQSTNYFIYDGWNLIATFGPTGVIQQSFVWGCLFASRWIGRRRCCRNHMERGYRRFKPMNQ
jgi:hypothetical protein